MDVMMIDDRMIREEGSKSSKLIKNPWDLEVFKRAYEASLAIHRKTLGFPKIEQYALASQLRRSSKSICANVSEGFVKQKYSKAEFARFITIAEASACETQVWLQFARDLDYIDKNEFQTWNDDFASIVAMLAKLRSKLT
jgi:four helix bundle protein